MAEVSYTRVQVLVELEKLGVVRVIHSNINSAGNIRWKGPGIRSVSRACAVGARIVNYTWSSAERSGVGVGPDDGSVGEFEQCHGGISIVLISEIIPVLHKVSDDASVVS